MIKQGMNLTEEQRGEMRHEAKVDVGSSKLSDDKKSAMESGDAKDLLKVCLLLLGIFFASILISTVASSRSCFQNLDTFFPIVFVVIF